jgi:hypothetical protein
MFSSQMTREVALHALQVSRAPRLNAGVSASEPRVDQRRLFSALIPTGPHDQAAHYQHFGHCTDPTVSRSTHSQALTSTSGPFALASGYLARQTHRYQHQNAAGSPGMPNPSTALIGPYQPSSSMYASFHHNGHYTLPPPSRTVSMPQGAFARAFGPRALQCRAPFMEPTNGPERRWVTTKQSLPALMVTQQDHGILSAHQIFLRCQIEVFAATVADVTTHRRGRNKAIVLGQVGIRCRHCAHVPLVQRIKGSCYYPASVLGLYQAAQNMCTNHLQCGLCDVMPDNSKNQFAQLLITKTASLGGGRHYWAEMAACTFDLVDTEQGIKSSRRPLSLA